MPRFTVTVYQTVVEVANCVVEAADEAAARNQALRLADDCELDFQTAEYGPCEVEDITRLED